MVGDAATLKVELEKQKRALVSPVESAVKVAPGGIHINVNAVNAAAECDVSGGEFIIKRRRGSEAAVQSLRMRLQLEGGNRSIVNSSSSAIVIGLANSRL